MGYLGTAAAAENELLFLGICVPYGGEGVHVSGCDTPNK
jgi:hypothetical protein